MDERRRHGSVEEGSGRRKRGTRRERKWEEKRRGEK